MGRSPCCEKVGLKKGPWTLEEDQKLLAYIQENGHGSWRALPAKAGLQRCGKSCRLRWTNYLRPDIKRGKFSLQEEQTIIQLHALLGNRWSAIATHLPKRTDNEIKNYWNTHLKKRLAKMGIDPVTHKPKSDGTLIGGSADGQSKSIANLSHMAQWESARLEAEARLVRDSKLRAPSTSAVPPSLSLQLSQQQQQQQQQSLDLGLGAWQGVWPKPTSSSGLVISPGQNVQIDLQSPTSTLSFSAAADSTLQPSVGNSLVDQNSTILMCHHDQRDELEDQRVELKCFGKAIGRIMSSLTDNMTKDDDDGNHRMGGILLASAAAGFSLTDTTSSSAAAEAALWINPESSSSSSNMIIRSGSSGGDLGPTAAGLFTELLLDDKCIDEQNSSEDIHQKDTDHRADHESDNNAEGGSRVVEDQDEDQDQDDHDHESNNYWNNILDLVNPSNSPPPVF